MGFRYDHYFGSYCNLPIKEGCIWMLVKRIGSLVLLLFLFVWTSSLSMADEGGKVGRQSQTTGVQGAKPLSLLSLTHSDGEKIHEGAVDIPIEPQFKFHFDKNIVSSTVWERNSKCFLLFSEKNESVPIKVTKIDDSIDSTMRQFVFVQPIDSLVPGTIYYLKVLPKLMAKNEVSILGGTTAGEGITMSFRTKGDEVFSSQSVENSGDKWTHFLSENWLKILSVTLLSAWILVEFVVKKRRRGRIDR